MAATGVDALGTLCASLALAIGGAIAIRVITSTTPRDIRLRATAVGALAALLVAAQGVAPLELARVPSLAPVAALLVVATTAGLTWRIPDRMQSWFGELGELAMLGVVLGTASIASYGTMIASGVCLAWAGAGVFVDRGATSHPAIGLVLVLGVATATLALHLPALGPAPEIAAVVAATSVAVTLAVTRRPAPRELGRRLLLAALGASAMVLSTWAVVRELDGRALLPALMGATLVEVVHQLGKRSPRPLAPDDLLEAEHETLTALGRLADPQGASTPRVVLSLEHMFPGNSIELLRSSSDPTTRGSVIHPTLLAEVCRSGVLSGASSPPLPRSAVSELRKLGPDATLLPVSYDGDVHGALLLRGIQPDRDTLAQARRFADLLASRLENHRLSGELQHKERLATLGTFAAALLHDLRSPLAAMRLDMQLLQRVVVGEDRGALADAIGALDRVLDELSGTLDFTRPLELDMGTLDLAALVDDVLRAHRSRAEKQAVVLERSITVREPPIVRGDRARLTRALENLIRNALEASPAGATVTVTVAMTGVEDGEVGVQRGVEVTVEDRGAGIDPDLGERVFEPFVTTKSEGVGLGLAIARKVVDAHHGRLCGRNVPQGGTAMTFWLPLAARERTDC